MSKTVKVFRNGRSLAVRVPKAWIGSAREVELSREGNRIVLTPKRREFESFLEEMRSLGPSQLPRRKGSKSGIRVRFNR